MVINPIPGTTRRLAVLPAGPAVAVAVQTGDPARRLAAGTAGQGQTSGWYVGKRLAECKLLIARVLPRQGSMRRFKVALCAQPTIEKLD